MSILCMLDRITAKIKDSFDLFICDCMGLTDGWNISTISDASWSFITDLSPCFCPSCVV